MIRARLGDQARIRERAKRLGDSMIVDVVVFNGVDELDAIGPYEVFAKAASAVPDLHPRLVALDAVRQVTGASGLTFDVAGKWVPGEADVLVVPGGGWGLRSDIGVYGEVQRGQWAGALQRARASTAVLAGVCTGTMLLASAGLVSGRRVNTHQSAVDDLRAYGAIVVDERVVDDGDIVTCGGVTSGLDLALWIVERQFGIGLVDGIARGIEYVRVRPASV